MKSSSSSGDEFVPNTQDEFVPNSPSNTVHSASPSNTVHSASPSNTVHSASPCAFCQGKCRECQLNEALSTINRLFSIQDRHARINKELVDKLEQESLLLLRTNYALMDCRQDNEKLEMTVARLREINEELSLKVESLSRQLAS